MGMVLTVPRYTIAELDEFPSDGNRYELLDGMLMVTPSPGSPHQSVATRLDVELSIAVQKPGLAQSDAYLALGVPEVWLVDIAEKSVEVCRAAGAGVIARDVVEWHLPQLQRTVRIELAELFAGLR